MNIMLSLILCITVVGAQQIRRDLVSHPHWRLLDQGENCGHSSSFRIIGGRDAHLGQYPWIARLGYMVSPDLNNVTVDMYGCGGTIISDRYILTAAHCHPKRLPGVPSEYHLELVRIRLGEHDIRTDVDCENGVCAPTTQDIDVEEYRCHRGFKDSVRQDDICLIRLVKPIQFNKYVYPICLPIYETLQRETFEKQVMEVAGWGIQDIATKQASDILQSLKVPIVQPNVCRQAYKGRIQLTEKQLCAGAVVGKDSCGGDSGGPLMTSISVGGPPRYFLAGIVSYGPEKCSVFPVPGVYTKVSSYLDWILTNVRE